MAYLAVPTRTSASAVPISTDINQLQSNVSFMPTEEIYRNGLINPFHLVNQRGVTTSPVAVVTAQYLTDRWQCALNTVTATAQQVTTSQPSSLPYSKSLKLIATNSVTGTMILRQLPESDVYKHYQGKLCYFSAWVKSNTANARLRLRDNAVNYFSTAHTGGGDWELLSATGTMSGGISSMLCEIMEASATGSVVSVTTGDYIETTGAKLSVYDDFEIQPRNQQMEVDLCKRFYQLYSGVWRSPRISLYTANALYVSLMFETEMRIAPTVTVEGTDGVDWVWVEPNNSVIGSVTNSSSVVTTKFMQLVGTKVAHGKTDAYFLTQSATGKLVFDAEL